MYHQLVDMCRIFDYSRRPGMSAIVATLTSLPYTQFRRNRYFYVWYDAFFIVLCGAIIAAVYQTGWQGIPLTWDWRLLLLLPIAAHLQILCSVWIHNATHNNFPRTLNRIVGEICGFIVLTRFASWEIIHQRHHKYSDDPTDDPHPIVPEASGYWPYLWKNDHRRRRAAAEDDVRDVWRHAAQSPLREVPRGGQLLGELSAAAGHLVPDARPGGLRDAVRARQPDRLLSPGALQLVDAPTRSRRPRTTCRSTWTTASTRSAT